MSQTIHESSATSTAPRQSRRWRGLAIALGVFLLLMTGAGVTSWYHLAAIDAELQAVIGELDATDPNWRLEDLEAQRKAVPQKKNAANIILQARRLLPSRWPSGTLMTPKLEVKIQELPAPSLLTAKESAALKKELKAVQPALIKARLVKDFPEGRYVMHHSPDFIDTLLQHVHEARRIAYFLELDIKMQCQEGNMKLAWEDCRALVNTSSSIGDEPFILSQLMRMTIRRKAIGQLERILAHSQIDQPKLAEMQKRLKQELSENLLLYALRGERAGMHRMCRRIEDGQLSIKKLRDLTRQTPASKRLWNSLSDRINTYSVKKAHTYLLRFLTKSIAKSTLPLDRLGQAFNELEKQRKADKANGRMPELAELVLPVQTKFAEAVIYARGSLHCAICALASERYRLKHKHWPDKLSALVKEKLLAKVPVDPYDGKPLRYKQTKNGVVVYSIGENKSYKGEALDNPYLKTPPVRIEFRLWNPDRRRMPARAGKKS